MRWGIDVTTSWMWKLINETRLRTTIITTKYVSRRNFARLEATGMRIAAVCERCKSNEVVTRTNPYHDRNFMRSRNGELTFSGYAILANPSLFLSLPLLLVVATAAAAALVILIPHRGADGGGGGAGNGGDSPCSHSQSARFLSLTVILILLPRGPPTSSNVRLLLDLV